MAFRDVSTNTQKVYACAAAPPAYAPAQPSTLFALNQAVSWPQASSAASLR
jgi:hypothetical protein